MSKSYPVVRYELRPSVMVPGQVGLFALRPFDPADVVAHDRYFDESRLISWAEFKELDELTRHKLVQYCYKTKKGVHAPRDINSIGICYFINHSCDPNVFCNKRGDFVALRHISVDEELTADLEKVMKITYSEFECACGAQNCRKRIRI